MADKKRILEYIEMMSDNQLNAIEEVVNIMNKGGFVNKTDMVKFINSNDKENLIVNYDTAYDIRYIRVIEESYPNINSSILITDYTKNGFGELVNLNDRFLLTLFKLLKD
jgi:hypothetical protein